MLRMSDLPVGSVNPKETVPKVYKVIRGYLAYGSLNFG